MISTFYYQLFLFIPAGHIIFSFYIILNDCPHCPLFSNFVRNRFNKYINQTVKLKIYRYLFDQLAINHQCSLFRALTPAWFFKHLQTVLRQILTVHKSVKIFVFFTVILCFPECVLSSRKMCFSLNLYNYLWDIVHES